MNSRLRFATLALLLSLAFGQAATPQSPTNDPGRLSAVVKDGKWGYIDNTGKLVIPHQYDRAYGFSEGLALVRGAGQFSLPDSKLGRGPSGPKWGYIDKTGERVISLKYDQARSFSGGLAAVKNEQGDRWGYIDKSGKMVIRPKFDHAGDFSEGQASVKVGEKWGIIDKTGRYVRPLTN